MFQNGAALFLNIFGRTNPQTWRKHTAPNSYETYGRISELPQAV